jgi:outer membrane protein TolC
LLEPAPVAEAPPAPDDSLALMDRVAHSPEVLAAGLAERTQELALDEARHRNALALGVEADAGLWGADLTRAVPPDFALEHPGATFADRLRGDFGVSLALNFRRPLFDPTTRTLTAARTQERAAAATRASTARAARERAMLDLLGHWQSAARRLALAESATSRAEDHSLRLRSLYAAGATSLLELLDARRQLDDARGRRADARFECRLARWERELS